MLHRWMSHVPRVKLHRWMSHVPRVNGSCDTSKWVMSHNECVMSHIWMSHVTQKNESCPACEWIMWHIEMSHATHVSESCHTCEWVISHEWRSHVTYIDESCHTCGWVISGRGHESCQTSESEQGGGGQPSKVENPAQFSKVEKIFFFAPFAEHQIEEQWRLWHNAKCQFFDVGLVVFKITCSFQSVWTQIEHPLLQYKIQRALLLNRLFSAVVEKSPILVCIRGDDPFAKQTSSPYGWIIKIQAPALISKRLHLYPSARTHSDLC